MHRHVGDAPGISNFAGVGHLGGIHDTDLRAAGFDGYHARDQLGTLVGDVEPDSAALRMSNQNHRTSDLIQ